MNCRRSAFTLVEIMIVLVVIGFLAGGVMVGQNLIRAAELRSVVKDYEKYKTAMHAFEDKYFALPGDMPNATDYWGSAGGGGYFGDGCENDIDTGTETCNGNGDGYIYGESIGFFQHLANAGLVERNFMEDPTYFWQKTHLESPVGGAVWEANTPRDVADGGGSFSIGEIDVFGQYFFEGSYKVVLKLYDATGNGHPDLEIADVMGIDQKMDDAKPGTGTVFTLEQDGFFYGCHDQNPSLAVPLAHLAEYTPDGSGPSGTGGTSGTGCNLHFRLN